jgi:chorismate dehydratase
MGAASGKIKVAAVSYLNTKPLLHGLYHHPVKDSIELSMDYPAKIGQQLMDGEVDLGLIPVALLAKLPQHHIITDYCIGAEGPVASVCLFSDVPLEEVTTIYLDYQSRSSVALARYLMREFWHLSPRWLPSHEGYEDKISGTTAGVVIGDRALKARHRHPYIYDLAEAWITHTGLPMVFAAWISNRPLPASFIEAFDAATGEGTTGEALEEVIAATPCDFFDLHAYYKKHISFALTEQKRLGLQRFLQVLEQPVVL